MSFPSVVMWWIAPIAILVVADPKQECDFSKIEVSKECPSEVGFDWESYGEELYGAKSLVFAGDLDGAQNRVFHLLSVITNRFSLAFECPIATAATYFTMGQIFAFRGKLRRALVFIHMGFIFVRDKGFNECTPWPVQGWDMILAGRNLVHAVQNLDHQSVTETPKQFRAPDQKVGIVTICSYAADEPVRVISEENHRLYAQLHGYDLHMFTDPSQIKPHTGMRMDVNDGVHKPFFWKVNAVMNVFDGPKKYDWLLWIDCDAFFMDPERTIDSVISRYTSNRTAAIRPEKLDDELRHRVLPGDPAEVSLLIATDSTGINNGVWMIKDTPWARGFLERWWHSNILTGAGANHNCSDQSTMQHELLYKNSMTLDHRWDEVEGPIWPAEVRVVPQEHMQAFHAATAYTVLSREWQDGDFIKHHPGCHYYKPPCQQLYLEAHTIFTDKVKRLIEQHQKKEL